MLLLLLFAFVAGVVTILSPCILPILPIILSGSVTGSKHRPLGIVAGFILSFSFFTLALATLVRATGISPGSLRIVASGVIFVFGLMLLVPKFLSWLELVLNRVTNRVPSANQLHGFLGGVVIGISLGLIWAPCVGPILAAVITLALSSQVSSVAVLITISYSIGTAIPMLGVMYGGQALLQRVPWLLRNTARIQKGFGVVMMVLALALVLNLDRRFQTFILTYAPQYGAGLTSFENNQLVQNQLDALQGRSSQKIVVGLQPQGSPAPEITEESWINSSPLALSQLKGKVVLVDFWTYSCINCIRTFPYLKKWYETYKDLGLVIVGVHSPEFEFEKDRQNVVQAVQDFGLTYPVVQDNDFEIWNRYSNRYWPAHYLIDAKGEIRYTHFGEGAYAETEAAIRALLEEAGEPVPSPVVTPDIGGGTRGLSPETYLGLSRLERFASKPSPTSPGEYKFEIYDQIPLHAFGYQGGWNLESESAQAGEQAALEMEFRAKQVFLVLTPASKSDVVTVMLDGQVVSTQQAGKDVTNGQVTVDEPRLYELILLDEVGQHRLRLEFLQPGTKVFAFTFG